MTVYEYRCAECDEKFELFVRSAAQKRTPICPKCGSAEVHKAISLFGIAGTSESSKTSVASCGLAPT